MLNIHNKSSIHKINVHKIDKNGWQHQHPNRNRNPHPFDAWLLITHGNYIKEISAFFCVCVPFVFAFPLKADNWKWKSHVMLHRKYGRTWMSRINTQQPLCHPNHSLFTNGFRKCINDFGALSLSKLGL